MPSPSPISATVVQPSYGTSPDDKGPVARDATAARNIGEHGRAEKASVSVAESAIPAPPADSPAAALGRRIFSTAFVRVGPDGRLTVELHDGQVLVLRDVVMRRQDYCGAHVAGDRAPALYCGGYADVAAARPGGGPAPDQPGPAVPPESRGSAQRN